jgi:phage FluMu protein Com
MADGSSKPIEAVEIGDIVQGAFGEHNTVLALHRPLLGAGCILNINGEHKTTTHHPHVAADKKIYCAEPKLINGFTYGKEHTVIVDKSGRKEKRIMYGLHKDRILKLEVGVELQTLTGARRVDTLETIKMSPFTQVYHLVVDGSHTFMVDGYAVTGWPREDDFDYDAWAARA